MRPDRETPPGLADPGGALSAFAKAIIVEDNGDADLAIGSDAGLMESSSDEPLECSVVNAAVLTPPVIPQLSNILRQRDFAKPYLGAIFNAAVQLYEEGIVTDAMDVVAVHFRLVELAEHHTDDDVLRLLRVGRDLEDQAIGIRHAVDCAALIAGRARTRRARIALRDAERRLARGGNPDVVVSDLARELAS